MRNNLQFPESEMAVRVVRVTAAGMLGVIATVLLHSLFLVVAMWGYGSAKVARLPDAVGAGANSGNANGTSTDRMIVIQMPTDSLRLDALPPNPAQLTAAPAQPTKLQVTGPDSLPLPPLEFDDEGEAKEATEADLIARTKLAGLYESQIRARIERAWERPNESVRALVYSCRVKVRQKRDGQVEDVSLENCEGSFEWLNSLVKAIYSASPLPGAPHPGVFASSFSMQFRSVGTQAARHTRSQ